MSSVQLHIAEPCNENWNAMLPEEKGRFCLNCQKTVVDFTNMTDSQIVDYFKNYNGNTCGQFTNQQLDRQIVKPKIRSIGRWKYFWQVFIPAFFAMQKAEAQQTKRGEVSTQAVCNVDSTKLLPLLLGKVSMVKAPPHKESVQPKYRLKGRVLDSKGNPVPFATIITDRNSGAVTDSLGQFSIVLSSNDTSGIIVSSVGFETKTILLNPLTTLEIKKLWETRELSKDITITLEEYAQVMLGMVVRVDPNKSKKKNKKSEILAPKVKSLIQPNETAGSLRIFPNPISTGQDFQISIAVKKFGNYILTVVNSSGNLVFEQRLNVSNNTYTTNVSGKTLQQPGVYFLNIVNENGGKEAGLTGRILVQ